MHSLMNKSAQNNSSNGRLDAALKGILHGRLNVVPEGATLKSH